MLFSQRFNDITSKTPFFPIIIGDFNARSKCWLSLDKQSKEGESLFSMISANGYTQQINFATDIIGNSSSQIDLIFTQQLNPLTSSGVHASLHNNCHHQIIFPYINLLIEYPPPYHRLIYDYCNSDFLNIRKYYGVIYFLIIILISIKQLIKERDSFLSKYQSQGRRDEDLHIVTSLTDKIN